MGEPNSDKGQTLWYSIYTLFPLRVKGRSGEEEGGGRVKGGGGGVEKIRDRLPVGSHETSPIIWVGKPAPAIQC